MSIYIPTVWKNNTTPSINATNLNHLEAGVSTAHREVEQIISGEIVVGKASTAILAETVTASSRTNLGGIRMWVDNSDPLLPIGYIEV